MLSINYNGFGLSKRGTILWQAACIAIIWVVWRERNTRIFQDKSKEFRESLGFYSFLCFSLGFLLQLDWLVACNSFELVQSREFMHYYIVFSCFRVLVVQFSLVGGFLFILLYFFFLLIYSFVVSYQKKKKNYIFSDFSSSYLFFCSVLIGLKTLFSLLMMKEQVFTLSW